MERIPRRESCAIKFPELGGHKPFGMLFAAINALPQSLAVVDSGAVLYVNLA
jgi:hypothetical protein